jgi:hypothetical protein
MRLSGRGSITNSGKILLLSAASIVALVPTQPPTDCASRLKRLGREAGPLPTIAVVKKDGAVPLLPHVSSRRGI